MSGKITRWVKVGLDDEEFAALLLECHDEVRDPSELLKVLWVRHMRAKVTASDNARHMNQRPFAAPSGPDGTTSNRSLNDPPHWPGGGVWSDTVSERAAGAGRHE